MINTNEIRRHFETRLAEWADREHIPLFVDNIGGKRPETLYLACHLLIAENSSGVMSEWQKNGIFQVTAYFPFGVNADEIDNKVQAIIDLFPPVSGEISIVGLPNRTGGQVVENRFCVVVSVNYVAY